jgi:hypothetical protein
MAKKTKTTSDPWKPAQPYILKGMQQTQRVFDQQQPQLDKYAGMAFDTYGQLNPGAVQGIQGAQGLVNDTLGGKFLGGANPYLNDMAGLTRQNVLNDTQGAFSAAGRYGSGAFANAAAKGMADAELGMRYNAYGQERQNQMAAVGQAQDLMRGNQGTLEQAAALPWTGVAAQTGNIRQASQGYGTTTTKESNPMGGLMGVLGAGATAFSGTNFASDERKKNRLAQVGLAPDGVTPLEAYTMKDDPTQTPQIGVMAQTVAETNPGALGPTTADGGASVNYAKLGLPSGPVDMQGQPSAMPVMDLPTIDKPPSEFESYLGRVLSPDASTTAGKLGIFGQALMASSGSAFAPLGQSLMAVRANQQNEDERAADEQHRAAVLALQGERLNQPEYKTVPGVGLVMIGPDGQPQVVQPEVDRGPTSGPLAYLQAMNIDPASPEGRRLLEGAMTNSPVAVAAQREIISHRQDVKPPPAAGGGGGGSKTPPKYQMGPNGKLMKWVG